MPVGKVWLVGAGPGDPGLITVRGLEVLTAADVVLYDALAHPALLEACPQAERRDVGKRYNVESPSQAAITEQLIELARAGKRVVRLKGGDPFLFARGSEEAEALVAAGIPFEVVPGIPAALGGSAYAGISLTHRELSSSVTVITGSDRAGKEWSPEAWKKLATATDTICVYMGMRRIEQITAAIVEGGRPISTPAAVVQWGTRPEQRVVVGTLGDIAERVRTAGVTNPAIILVGDVVSLRNELRWYDRRPLFGKRILVPRAPHQAEATARAIRERSAEPIVLPVIEIVAPPDPEPLARAAREAQRYDWIVFTSANGVDRFFAALWAEGRDARALAEAKVAVIGPKTGAALEKYGLRPDLVAAEFVGEAVGQALLARGPVRRVLIPRALVARDALPEMLRAAGAEVNVVAAYQTKPVSADRAKTLREKLACGEIDVAMFTSGSTVASMFEILGDDARALLARVVIASIGPVTSKALAERGLTPTVTAAVYTVAGLLDALEAHFGERESSPPAEPASPSAVGH
jgi:uroporphyrinogen III methyltransferase/synthase